MKTEGVLPLEKNGCVDKLFAFIWPKKLEKAFGDCIPDHGHLSNPIKLDY